MGIKVSVALCCFNQESFIEECLEAWLSQMCVDYEMVIVDDNSEDDTVEVINAVLSRFGWPENVLLLKNEVNLGIARNFQRAIEHCSGDYIAIGAGDDFPHKQRLIRSLEALLSDSSATALFSNARIVDVDSNKGGLLYSSRPDYCTDRSHFLNRSRVWALGASFIFRRDVYFDFGSFLAGTYAEDGCLAFRSILLGKLLYLDEPLIFYRLHGGNVSRNLSIDDKVKFKAKDLILYSNMLKDALLYDPEDAEVLAEISRRRRWVKFIDRALRIRFLAVILFNTSVSLRNFRNCFKLW